MMTSLFFLCLGICVAMVTSEYCMHDDSECINERCPTNYVARCLPDHVCSCEHAGECSVSNDCENLHGKCENNDKHWYCNDYKCCCGEPCKHAGDHFICSTPSDCQSQFFRCTNNDKRWHCTGSDGNKHCHCGSDHGSIHS